MAGKLVFLALMAFLVGCTCAQEQSETSTAASTSTATSTSSTSSVEAQDVTTTTLMQPRPVPQDRVDFGNNQKPDPAETAVCGSPYVCTVEADVDGNGLKDCCSRENNLMCEKCLGLCMRECEKGLRGVSRCFPGVGDTPVCECTNEAPTCYKIRAPQNQTTSTSTTLPNPESGETSNVFYYLFAMGIVVVGLVAAVNFVHKAG